MPYNLPENINTTSNKLSSVFNNTTASYKFYWFISLLQLFVERGDRNIPIKDILVRMICNAWYPINYFKLNFGFSDKLDQNIDTIQSILNIPMDISLSDLYEILQNSTNPLVNNLILHFDQHVPFRFLSPWINGSKRDVVEQSQYFKNNCLYSLNTNINKQIEINPHWVEYLTTNNKILLDFTYWNLLQYLQTRNPNVPNIGNKLIKPIIRGSLTKQRDFWNLVLSETASLKCIYTGRSLQVGNFDVEHFIPWSFVSHDQMWNLIPADSSINCSKSNKLPPLDKYFDSFVDMQYEAIKIVFDKKPKIKLLEDYMILGSGINDIVQKPYSEFKEKYYKVLSPLIQIASNSGFEFWKNTLYE